MKLSFTIMFADHQMKDIKVLSSGGFDVPVSGENNSYQFSLLLLEKMLVSEKFGFNTPTKRFSEIVTDYFKFSNQFILEGNGVCRIGMSLQDEPDDMQFILDNYPLFGLEDYYNKKHEDLKMYVNKCK